MWLWRMRLLVLPQIPRVAARPRGILLHSLQGGGRPFAGREHFADPGIAREPLAYLAQATGGVVGRRLRGEEPDAQIAATLAYRRREAVAHRKQAEEHIVRARHRRRVGDR